MITCNRCGYMSPNGTSNCPKCGELFSSNRENGFDPQMGRGGQEQSELPAWLGSLRVGEGPAAHADSPEHFSAADLFGEGTLPSWMRSERPEIVDPSHAGMVSEADLTKNEGAFPPKGFNAQSLIDEQSLPSWMQENKSPTSSTPSSGISGSSLVQSDALPDWMKSLQQQYSSAPQPSRSNALSQEPLSSPQAQSASAPQRMPLGEVGPPLAHGFSPRELIDDQSLPAWMSQQNNQESPIPANSEVPGQSGKLSPASLVDVNSLPSWLSEGRQDQRNVVMPPSQSASASQGWQTPAQSVQPPATWQAPQPPMQSGPIQNNGLTGPSLIDSNALPEWLRSANGQPQPTGPSSPQQASGPARSGVYGGPPQVDNVRVPSRPRNGMNANESNEVAANVFASMLGVASASPQLQSSPVNAPPWQQGQQGVSYMPQGQVPPPQSQGMAGMSAQYAPGGYNGGYPANMQGNAPTGNYSPGAMPQYTGGSPGMPPTPNRMSPGNEQKSTKKRGLVEALREWLFH